MIKVAIVDDEENALYAIRTYVEKELLPSDETEILLVLHLLHHLILLYKSIVQL